MSLKAKQDMDFSLTVPGYGTGITIIEYRYECWNQLIYLGENSFKNGFFFLSVILNSFMMI